MFQALANLHKLFSKRYFVLFFDKKAMPEEGTFITIGDLTGELKKTTYDKVKEQMEKIGQVVQDKMYAPPDDDTLEIITEMNIFWCRKCKIQMKEDVNNILVCKNCGYREVKK